MAVAYRRPALTIHSISVADGRFARPGRRRGRPASRPV